MINLSKQYLHRVIVFLWFLFLVILSWKSTPVNIDEYYSLFIAKGIPIGCLWNGEARSYITASNCIQTDTVGLSAHRPWRDTYSAAVKDGGNAIFYYSIAHYWMNWFGSRIGIVNSLRLLSFLFSFLTLMILSSFLYDRFGSKGELIGSLFYISVAAPNLLFIRTYSLAVLFVTILMVAMIKWTDVRFRLRNSAYLLFFLVAMSLPFIHFFTIHFILIGIGFLLFKWYEGLSSKHVIPALIPFMLSIVIFCFYYLHMNREGRLFQKQLGEWYTEVSANASLKEYKPSIKLSLVNVIKKNGWAGARSFGLKLNQPHFKYPYHSAMHVASYVLLSLFIVLFLLFGIYFFKSGSTESTRFCMYGFMAYFILLNLMSIKLGNLIIFNEQYFFVLFPFTTILFTGLYLKLSALKPMYNGVQLFIFAVIIVNALVYCFLPPEMDADKTHIHARILATLEYTALSTR